MSTYADLVEDALKRAPRVTPEEVAERAGATIIDVREPDETQTGIIQGALLLPRGRLEEAVGDHVPNLATPIVVYCASGKRSALAADALVRMGYASVRTLDGGIERWRAGGFPVAGGAPACMTPGPKKTWPEVRREFAIVQRTVPVLGAGERELVYMDHAASTHAPESVLAAYVEFMQREYANVHRGTHLLSRKATERFEEAQRVVARYIGGELEQGCVTFTMNTTQAIDLCAHVMTARGGKVLTTEMEHHSNELPHRARAEIVRARVTETGELDLDHLADLLQKNDVKLVCVTAGSNVTGLMPDVHAIARLAHARGALVLVDAAQALARAPLDVKDPSDPGHIDFLAGAGHKAYAPFGAGFLYGPRALMSAAPPYIAGGGTAAQVTPTSVTWLDAPDRHQGGTPNIAGVVGMARALLFLQSIGLPAIREHEIALTKRTVDAMRSLGGVTIYGDADPHKRLGVVSFNVDGVPDMLTAAVLSEEGAIAVRNGRFCSHVYCSRLLRGAEGAVRASFGVYSDEGDVDRLIEMVKRVRDREWRGRYKTVGDEVSAEFAGRCADRWMEAAPTGPHGQT